MTGVPPVEVVHLFPEERQALLELLRSLSPRQWDLPTVCVAWSVKEIVAHVLGDDLGVISGGGDGFLTGWFSGGDWDELVAFINKRNEAWVDARSLSPCVLLEMLAFTGKRLQEYFRGLHRAPEGPSVSRSESNQALSEPVFRAVAITA